MSKRTDTFVKRGTIKLVINKLNGISKHKKKVDKLIECKNKHLENMSLISLTLVVLNEDRFIDCKEEHPSNIQPIFSTLVRLLDLLIQVV